MISPEKLQGIVDKFESIERQLGDPDVIQDMQRLKELSKEHARLPDIVEVAREYQKVSSEHQEAREAMPLLYPLLSEQGTVELQPGGNTLVVRDRGEVLRKLLPVLQDYQKQYT